MTVSIHKTDEGRWILRIEDKGIGMSLNTITGYFLNAGAFFRLSTVWKEKFIDEKGKTKVLRSGRFGVGALAAFMLAEDPTTIEMRVTTRHITSKPDGAFEFITKLSDTPIQIKYVEKKEPGTIIEITTINPPAFMQESTKENAGSSWDWFCLDKPIVDRFALNGKRLQQAVLMPSTHETARSDYHWITPEEYDSIGWTYSEYPAVVCNGIIVIDKTTSNYSLADGKFVGNNIKITMPSLSIFDKDGKLPITLDRLRIEFDQLQFLRELREDIEKNILAFLLLTAPTVSVINEKKYERPLLRTHPAIKASINQIPWLSTEKGSIVYCPELLSIIKKQNIFEISDISLVPFIIENLENEIGQSGIAVECYSIWDEIQNNHQQMLGGSRLKIDKGRIDSGRLYRLLDSFNSISRHGHTFQRKDIVETLLRKYPGIDLDSVQVLQKEIEQEIHKVSRTTRTAGRLSDFNEMYYSFRHEMNDENSIHRLRKLLYDLGKTSKNDERTILSLFKRAFKGADRRRYRHNIDELIFRIEREFEDLYENDLDENFYRLQDEFRKFKHDHHDYYDIDTLEEIFKELKDLNETLPTVNYEKFGNEKRILDWEKIKGMNFGKRSKTIPVTEFVLNENFKLPSSNNILSKIWLEYIGNREIPLDESFRNDLITELQIKYNLQHHLQHWKDAIAETKIKEK